MTLGEKILNLRKERNLNQEELAEKINVTRQTISNWENDITVPDFYQAIDLSKALEIDLNELAEEDVKEESTVSSDDNELFEKLLDEIKKELNPVVFATLYKDLKFVDMDNGKIVIECLNGLTRRKLSDDNYKKMIIEKATKVYNTEINNVLYVDKL